MCELAWLWKLLHNVYKYTIALYTLNIYIIFICHLYLNKADNYLKTKKLFRPTKLLWGLQDRNIFLPRFRIRVLRSVHLTMPSIPSIFSQCPKQRPFLKSSFSYLSMPILSVLILPCFIFSVLFIFKIISMLLHGASYSMGPKFPKSSILCICYIVT